MLLILDRIAAVLARVQYEQNQVGRIDEGRYRLLFDGVSLFFGPVQESWSVQELDPLAPHVTVAEDHSLRGEGI